MEQQICVSASIFCIMRENWPILLLLVGIMAGRQEARQAGRQEARQAGRQAGRQEGRQAGRQADEIQVSFKIFKILYRLKLFGLLICLISLQCYYSVF